MDVLISKTCLETVKKYPGKYVLGIIRTVLECEQKFSIPMQVLNPKDVDEVQEFVKTKLLGGHDNSSEIAIQLEKLQQDIDKLNALVPGDQGNKNESP